jgi:N6-L-threonylcarbamoyladenine synthase/tRNA threonylcarbamoyladenosine biosynthesis protein TsaB
MKILALETSTHLAGVAVIQDGKVVAEESSLRQRSHSEVLNVFIDNCLKKSNLTLNDIDVFAVGQGPGSFTGLRVAGNAAKTLGYCYNKPLVTIDSLMLLAAMAPKSSRPVLSIINAFKNMVYLGIFDVQGDIPKYLKGPEAVPVRELSKYVDQDMTVVGDGWEAFHEFFPEQVTAKLHRTNDSHDYPQAATLGLLAELKAKANQTLDWKSFLPLYIRASEAEEQKKGILISPLK